MWGAYFILVLKSFRYSRGWGLQGLIRKRRLCFDLLPALWELPAVSACTNCRCSLFADCWYAVAGENIEHFRFDTECSCTRSNPADRRAYFCCAISEEGSNCYIRTWTSPDSIHPQVGTIGVLLDAIPPCYSCVGALLSMGQTDYRHDADCESRVLRGRSRLCSEFEPGPVAVGLVSIHYTQYTLSMFSSHWFQAKQMQLNSNDMKVHPIWKLNAFTCFVAFSFLEVGACCVQVVF